jgi:hypothetical protein
MEVTTVTAPKYTPSRFHDWDRMVREPLLWLGVADPFATAADVFADDPARADLAALIEALEKAGVTTKSKKTAGEIATAATPNGALANALGDYRGAVSIGKFLRGYIDTPCNGKTIRREEYDHQKRYWVETLRTLV